jgi:hypothetical protein
VVVDGSVDVDVVVVGGVVVVEVVDAVVVAVDGEKVVVVSRGTSSAAVSFFGFSQRSTPSVRIFSWGQCYYHCLRQFSPIFGAKNGDLLKTSVTISICH